MQALRKLSRKVKGTSSSRVSLMNDSLTPPTQALLVEHKSTVKGACLQEGEVRV